MICEQQTNSAKNAKLKKKRKVKNTKKTNANQNIKKTKLYRIGFSTYFTKQNKIEQNRWNNEKKKRKSQEKQTKPEKKFALDI